MIHHDYPWLADAARRLQDYRQRERLPHALLITGPAGLGQLQLAEEFIQSVFCREPGDDGACGKCSACTQFLAGSFADYHEVTLEEDDKGKLRKQIVVDQVRRLSETLGMMASQGGWKAALVHPADAMNTNAANSLLKTLEEPPARSLIVLVSHRPAMLPATIRSRCQQLAVRPCPPEIGEAWLAEQGVDEPAAALAYANGSPLRALELHENGLLAGRAAMLDSILKLATRRQAPVPLAEELEKSDVVGAVEWLEAMTEDLIRLRQVGEDGRLRNPDLVNSLKTMAERLNLEALHRYLKAVRQGRRLLDSQANTRLLLESLLLPWAQQLDDTVINQLLEG
ncbi:MAG: DNA polymerase III subunit delta' [Gammaproteobacteria bacterium]|nr:DNA polymerase III subunit delta' [Gammaproteobacteria bacterium]